MKNKRVGTITMALCLIALGILIFVSQISGVSALNISLKIWPLMLISLGLEILYYRFVFKDEDLDIKYDIFSIFLITIVLLTNLGIYTLVEIGIVERLKTVIW